MMTKTTVKNAAPVLLRIGMSAVFLAFSYYQFTGPSMWTIYVPDSITALVGGNAVMLVLMNAWFELIAGLCLLAGFQVRIAALLLALHLFGIAATIGLSPLGIRDFGLAVATLSIFFQGYDALSLDKKLLEKAEQNAPSLTLQ